MPKIKDYTGQIKGKLTAIKFISRIKYTIWLFRCACGTEKEINVNTVFNGDTVSCGCAWHSRDLSLNPSLNKLIQDCKKNARERRYIYNLTKEQILFLTAQKCHYCGMPPVQSKVAKRTTRKGERLLSTPYLYNGIDRKDNDIGYIYVNCVPCCTICNRAKNNMPYENFMAWIKQLRNNF